MPSKISDSAAAASIASLLKSGCRDTVRDALETGHWTLPMRPADCRVVLDRMPVIPLVFLKHRKAQRLLALLADDTEAGKPMIVFDDQLSGSDAMFLFIEVTDLQEAGCLLAKYAALQSEVCAATVSIPDRIFVSFRLTNFF